MSILIIGPEEESAIKDAIAKARANPLPLQVGQRFGIVGGLGHLMLKDRKPGTDAMRKMNPPQQIMLGSYRAAFSFEQQPKIGLCKHLSVSSHAKGKVPGPEVMTMVCEAFGFSGLPLQRPGRVWVEEFEPGRMAVNVVEVEP